MKPPAEIDQMTTLKNVQTWYSINPTWKLCFQLLKHDENYFSQDDFQSQDPRPWSIEGRYWVEGAPRKILDESAEKLTAELLAEILDLTLMRFGLKT